MMLGNEGIELLILYQKTLKIALSEAVIIIMKNETAKSILQEELALTFTGRDKNLSSLMSSTILRDFYDFESIRESEKELIQKYYNIQIGKDNFLINYGGIKNLDGKTVQSDEDLIILYVERFLKYEKIHNKISKRPIKRTDEFGGKCLRAASMSNRNKSK